MIDKETKNYIDPKFKEIDAKFDDFKAYLETEFTFKLILGMSKVFVTKDDFKNDLKTMEERLNEKMDSLARMIQKDIAIPHEKRLLTLERKAQNL